MIRTILVPASGSETDAIVFETALAAARPCQAHLEFFHVRVSSGEPLRYTPHASFARGKALRGVLQELKQESQNRCEAARCYVREFCKQHKITMADAPGRLDGISASWREEAGNGEEPFITRARVDPAADPEASWADNHRGAMLRKCLGALSPEHRTIIDLVYYHEKSVQEVAAIVGIPCATVKTRMFYARKKLAACASRNG
jgi:RNA polymerase sigma factor (sigma-70 family)